VALVLRRRSGAVEAQVEPREDGRDGALELTEQLEDIVAGRLAADRLDVNVALGEQHAVDLKGGGGHAREQGGPLPRDDRVGVEGDILAVLAVDVANLHDRVGGAGGGESRLRRFDDAAGAAVVEHVGVLLAAVQHLLERRLIAAHPVVHRLRRVAHHQKVGAPADELQYEEVEDPGHVLHLVDHHVRPHAEVEVEVDGKVDEIVLVDDRAPAPWSPR